MSDAPLPYAILHRNTALPLTTLTLTAVPFNVAELDPASGWQAPSHPTRYKIGAGSAGIYQVLFGVSFEHRNDDTRRFAAIQINGLGALIGRRGLPAVKSATLATDVSNPGRMVHLAVNDYIELIVRTEGAGTLLSATFSLIPLQVDQ